MKHWILICLFIISTLSQGGSYSTPPPPCQPSSLKIPDNNVRCLLNSPMSSACQNWRVLTMFIFTNASRISTNLAHAKQSLLDDVTFCTPDSHLAVALPNEPTVLNGCNGSVSFGVASTDLLATVTPSSSISSNSMFAHVFALMMEGTTTCASAFSLNPGEAGVLYIFSDFNCSATNFDTLGGMFNDLQILLTEGYNIRIVLYDNTDVIGCLAYLNCMNCTLPQCRLVEGTSPVYENTCPAPIPSVASTTTYAICSSTSPHYKITDDNIDCPMDYYNGTCDSWRVVSMFVFDGNGDQSHIPDHFYAAVQFLNNVNSYCQRNSHLIVVTPMYTYNTLGNNCNDSLTFGDDRDFLSSIAPSATMASDVVEQLNEMLTDTLKCLNPATRQPPLAAGVVYIFSDFDCTLLYTDQLNDLMSQVQQIMRDGLIVRIVLFGNLLIPDCSAYIVKCLNCSLPNCALLDGSLPSTERTCSINTPPFGPSTYPYGTDTTPQPEPSKVPPSQMTTPTTPTTTSTTPKDTTTVIVSAPSTSSKPPINPPSINTTQLVLLIGIPCGTLVLCCGICACVCIKCTKLRQRTIERVKGQWRGDRSGPLDDDDFPRGKVPTAPNFDNFAAANHYMDIKQLAARNKKDYWELPSKNLMIHENEILGTGAFANVYRGTLTGKIPLLKAQSGVSLTLEHQKDGRCETAVKRLPPHADEQNRMDFFHEIDFMKRLGYHVHIIAMLGCVSDAWDPLILVEYCHYGDMLKFLRNHRSFVLTSKDDVCPVEADMCLRIKDLVSFAWQISDGMSYLCSKNFIHRDLAARNVLLTKNLVAKVSDFGLCRYIDSALYTAKGGKLPIKWMAVESLKFYEYSFKTDVWAYGVALFEIFSLGDGPYQAIQPLDMLSHLERGNRLAQPERCPNEIYQLMMRCWAENADDRPTFNEIRAELTAMLNMDDEHYGYLSMGDDGPPTTRSIENIMERQITSMIEDTKLEVTQPPPIPDRPPKKQTKEADSRRKKVSIKDIEIRREGVLSSEDAVLEAMQEESKREDERVRERGDADIEKRDERVRERGDADMEKKGERVRERRDADSHVLERL